VALKKIKNKKEEEDAAIRASHGQTAKQQN
jgi:hypothetical protein